MAKQSQKPSITRSQPATNTGDKKILEEMAAALEKEGLSVYTSADVLRIPITAAQGSWTCFIRVAQDTLILLSQIPSVPPDKTSQVAELFTRLNYSLLVGNFEFDSSDQDTRFRTTIPLDCLLRSEKSFSTLFGYHTSAIFAHFAEIMKLYYT